MGFLGIPALFLGLALWAAGFRRRVVGLNQAYLGIKTRRGFRARLCVAAARDFCAVFSGAFLRPALPARSAACLRAMQRGPCLLLTAHFHNWELLGGELTRRGLPLVAAARPMKSARAQRLLVWARRRQGLATVCEAVPRAALRHVEQGGCFALLWDQHAPASEFSGRFFRRAVLLNPLPYFLLRRRFCPVYFGLLLPDGNMRLLPLLTKMQTGWEDKLARRYHRALETAVRRRPEHWYGFFHARFKNIAPYPGHRKMTPSPLPLCLGEGRGSGSG